MQRTPWISRTDEEPTGRLTRRDCLAGALAVTGAACTGATAGFAQGSAAPAGPVDLAAVSRVIDVNGRAANVFGIRQKNGQSGVEFNVGERFRVRLTNNLTVPTLVHWHGLTPPIHQDGVPELSQPALEPGQSADYDFPLARAGTNWMHSHVGLQEQLLHSAPLIVRDPAEAGRDEQEVVIMLHDFSFRSPEEIIAGLARAGMHGMAVDHQQRGMTTMRMDSSVPSGPVRHGDVAGSGAHVMPMPGAPGTASAQNHSAMSADLNDVDYDAFLANDRTLADPEIVQVERGGRVRLRIVNASAATGFFIDLGSLEGQVIAVDGMPVQALRGRWLDLATAQRLDIRLDLPAEEGAYPILAQREGDVSRTGVILATPKGAVAQVPDKASQKAGAIGFDLERKLRPAEPGPGRWPVRTFVVNLTGSMSPYVWTLNGQRYGEGEPLRVRRGEWVEIDMRNQTAMSHPMHLHGHHFQVLAINGERFDGALRDTVLVPAQARVTIGFQADNPGRWAFHCHNLYHLVAGMMTEVRYDA